MIDFIEYVVSELKSKRLSKTNALALIKQFSLHSTTTPKLNVLHPLLHSNTSDLNQQSYCTTFYGDEFFLRDHNVKGQKVLPGVAYLEMARAAVGKAVPFQQESTLMELRNVVWLHPIVVREVKEVTIALFASDKDVPNGQIDFEIYSTDVDAEGEIKETIHCQGQVVFINESIPEKLEIGKLREQTQQGLLESNIIYSAYDKLGLSYGPSHKGIKTIYQGDKQLLAQLILPEVVESNREEYLLHPSMMDSALQTAIGFFGNLNQIPDKPSLPFALESVKVFSSCTKEMFAWVRYSPGSHSNDKITKMDIDLCDQDGNISVQMRGFTSRDLRNEISNSSDQEKKKGALLAVPVWKVASAAVQSSIKVVDYTQHQIILCDIPNANLKQIETSIAKSKCLSLQVSQQKNIAERYSEFALGCFEQIQKILKDKPKGKVLIQIVVAYNSGETFFTGLSGLIKTATLENPQLIGQVILVEPQVSLEQLTVQLQLDQSKPNDTIIKYNQGIRYVLSWDEILTRQEKPAIAFKDRGVYMFTGGLGGLSILFVKEILKQTKNAKIILTDRSELTAEKQAVLDELHAQVGQIVYQQLDINNSEQVNQLMANIIKDNKQLNGIFHCAGMISDNFILKKTFSEFNQVLAPKVIGTFNLDEASKNADLDFLILFSSITATTGNNGQADYATANGFMDEFAVYRNSLVANNNRKGKTISINWPLWQKGGMSIDKASQDIIGQTTGMYPMQTETGIQAFYNSLELQKDQLLVVEGDLFQLRQALFADQPNQSNQPVVSPIISKVEETQAVKVEETQVVKLDAGSLEVKTQDYIKKQLSELLKMPSHKIDPQASLEKYGIDSILAMNLTNQLERTFGSLPKTLFFEYQTIFELTDYFVKSHSDKLASLLGTVSSEQKKVVSVTVEPIVPQTQVKQVKARPTSRQRYIATPTNKQNSITTDQIAIVGLSGRYPESIDIDEYWKNLRDGKDCITEIPESRWDWHEYYSENRSDSGHHFSKWGGFISGVDEFDPRFFNISPREAVFVDPQERLFLQHAWMAIEDAGYTRSSIKMSHENDLAGQVGVYVGVMYNEYQLFGVEASMRGKRMSIPGSYASIANRISYVLNLHGPSMTLDTMCSSSLTAIHLACQDLKLDRTKLAIAGGVNVTIHPNKYLVLSDGQFISTNGHCQSFGEGGDGYIPGEGVGVVILKKLSDAIKDGNHIYGVIKGSAINHGGKTNGYSVPNPQAQTSVINRALAESKINPRHISYIEAHGTGTKLGDPIEIAALSKAFQQYTPDNEFCFIGSNKSNIGHCESAAGISALTKVLLQLKYHKIVPSLHSKTLNPYIDFPKTPFIVNQTLREWEQPIIDGQKMPRIAGISAFGAGGSNAHMIIEEYVSPTKPINSVEKIDEVIIPLSAKTPDQLKQKANDLLKFITSTENNNQPKEKALELNKHESLVSMAYTLQVGREAMEERVGFIVDSIDLLVEKLKAYISGKTDVENMYQGQIKSNKGLLSSIGNDADFSDTLDKWLFGKKLSKVLEFWVNGLELDWNKLYGDIKPSYMSLPTYPFAKERYWFDVSKYAQVDTSKKVSSFLHPLLHTNTSDFNQQSYSSTFSGQEFFVDDCQISRTNGHRQKLLPSVAFLEMARTAIDKASPTQQKSIMLELRNIVWGQPTIINGSKQITIALFEDSADNLLEKQIDYEIYSHENDTEIVHCMGQAVFNNRPKTIRLDIDKIIKQIGQSRTDAKNLYIILNNMGFNYSPASQCIKGVYQGGGVLLAELSLPSDSEVIQGDFILHPSLMNSVLQSSIGLIMDSMLNHPLFPIALESLSIHSACTKEMYALIRYSQQEQQIENKHIKLDIDLCDQQGNICVQMRGLSLQQLLFGSENKTIVERMPIENTIKPTQANLLKPKSIELTGLNDLNTVTSTKAKPQSIQLINS